MVLQDKPSYNEEFPYDTVLMCARALIMLPKSRNLQKKRTLRASYGRRAAGSRALTAAFCDDFFSEFLSDKKLLGIDFSTRLTPLDGLDLWLFL